MNIPKIKEAMETMKKNAGDGLVVSTIIGLEDGQSLLNFNSDPKTDALVAKMSSFMVQMWAKSATGIAVEDYYIVDMENDMATVVLMFDKYCWALGINKTKLQMGMLLNVIIPECMEMFKAAV